MSAADRELLELAAKAAGYEVFGDQHPDDGLNVLIHGRAWVWRPQQDDGDALRLAHALRMKIDFTTQTISHYRIASGVTVYGHFGMETVRRFIVQIAAQLAALPPEKFMSMEELAAFAARTEPVFEAIEAERAAAAIGRAMP